MNEEKVYYCSSDNIKLCGVLTNANDEDEIVIMCHGIRGNKDERNSFKYLAEELSKNGYNSFRFDFRAHGESQGKDYEMTITKEILDLEFTINMLQDKGYNRFILLGSSFGAGIVSLFDFSKYTNIKGIISWYGALDYEAITDNSLFSKENEKIAKEQGYFTTISKGSGKEFKFGLQLFEEVRRLIPYENLIKNDIPKLFVHGKIDTLVPYQLSEKVAKLCTNSILELIEDGDHTFDNSEKSLQEAVEKTIKFIENTF